MFPNNEYGYLIQVTRNGETAWLGRRVYMSYSSALAVKHNLMDSKRYEKVVVLQASHEDFHSAQDTVK